MELLATQYFKRNLFLNVYRKGEKPKLVCFFLPLKREIKNVWHLQPISSIWRPLAFLPVTSHSHHTLSLSSVCLLAWQLKTVELWPLGLHHPTGWFGNIVSFRECLLSAYYTPNTELDRGQHNQFCDFRQWYRPWRKITWVREREWEDNHFRSDLRRLL